MESELSATQITVSGETTLPQVSLSTLLSAVATEIIFYQIDWISLRRELCFHSLIQENMTDAHSL